MPTYSTTSKRPTNIGSNIHLFPNLHTPFIGDIDVHPIPLCKAQFPSPSFYITLLSGSESCISVKNYDLSTLCRRTISLTYSLVNCSIVSVLLIGRNWAHLVSLSTITQIEFFLLEVLGDQTTKSIVTSSHFHSVIGSGYSLPIGL